MTFEQMIEADAIARRQNARNARARRLDLIAIGSALLLLATLLALAGIALAAL